MGLTTPDTVATPAAAASFLPPPATDLPADYCRHMRHNLLAGGMLVLATVVVAAMSLQTGAYPLAPGDLLDALVGQGTGPVRHIFWHIRLPQVMAGLLAGFGLGLAGTAMQSVLRNPLASPFTLGVSQGATFGATFAIIVLGAGQLVVGETNDALIISPWIIVTCAFAGSLLTIGALVLLSLRHDLSPSALILAGVALSAFFGSATMLLQYVATDVQVASAVFWTFGDLRKVEWRELGLMTIALLPTALFLWWRSWQFNAMAWGDDTAKSLGIEVRSLRFWSLVLVTLTASITTAFLGIIGFVGLVAPHVVRLRLGSDHRFLFPYAALAGGLLLLLADLLARTLLAPVVLPVGIVTSLAGAPVFLFLLTRNGNIRS